MSRIRCPNCKKMVEIIDGNNIVNCPCGYSQAELYVHGYWHGNKDALQERSADTPTNNAMVPCNIWREGGTCSVVAYGLPCGVKPCQVSAQHR